MKSSEFIKEAELSRRGFLKGAGAAALAGAASNAKALTDNEAEIVYDALMLYYFCKYDTPNAPSCKNVISSVHKFASSSPARKRDVNEFWQSVKHILDQKRTEEPEQYEFLFKLKTSFAGKIIDKLNSFTEF